MVNQVAVIKGPGQPHSHERGHSEGNRTAKGYSEGSRTAKGHSEGSRTAKGYSEGNRTAKGHWQPEGYRTWNSQRAHTHGRQVDEYCKRRKARGGLG